MLKSKCYIIQQRKCYSAHSKSCKPM